MEKHCGDSVPPATVRHRGVDLVSFALACYYFTTLIPVLAVVGGHEYLKPGPHVRVKNTEWADAFANWDGEAYRAISDKGYSFDPNTASNVAFFPAFPFVARLLGNVTGLGTNEALLLVAHVCLAGTFLFMAKYLRLRLGENSARIAPWALLSLGLFPTSFFFRMAYSESFFFLTAILSLYGMERKWPLLAVALVVGLSTAARPVGVALLAPLVLHIINTTITFRGRLLKSAVFVPLACWGILGYMALQWIVFDEPLAFAKTQSQWRIRPVVSMGEQAISLLALEPIWSVYDPSSPCYWGHHSNTNPLFSMQLANPVYFVGSSILIFVGWLKGWLVRKEVALAAGLLLIPYVTRSHEMCMESMGRFTAVVFPVYLVLGHLLSRIPAPVAALLLALGGFWMGVYSALFAAWYRVF